jgi:hypothetical protein
MEGVRGRPWVLRVAGGASELLPANLPILSFTEPTSGPDSGSISVSAWRFIRLAKTAAVAADDWGFTLDDGRD